MKQVIIEAIYRKEDIAKLETKLKLFGVSRKLSTASFLNIRLFTSLVILILSFLLVENNFVLVPIFVILYYYAFTYFLIDRPLKIHGRKLEHEAFYFFEVLTLSLESGHNFEKAIEASCAYIDSEIAAEFRETLYHVKFGKSLAEALNDMKKRIPSEAINNILINIMQSSLFGSCVIETLYNQIDFLREKRIMEIKAEISKIPTKISVFSVVFVVPLILMLIIAPLVIEYIANLQ